jgi:hypothetical protein
MLYKAPENIFSYVNKIKIVVTFKHQISICAILLYDGICDVSIVLCTGLSDIFSVTEMDTILAFVFLNLKDKTSAVKTQHILSLYLFPKHVAL